MQVASKHTEHPFAHSLRDHSLRETEGVVLTQRCRLVEQSRREQTKGEWLCAKLLGDVLDAVEIRIFALRLEAHADVAKTPR